MRILMVIDGLAGGGAEKVVLTLCEGMQKMGHSIALISLRDICKYPIPKGVHYHIVLDSSRTIWRKVTELSRRASVLDQKISSIERVNGAFDLVFSSLHQTDRIISHSVLFSSDRLWFCIHSIFSTSYLDCRKSFARWLKKRKIVSVYQQRNIVAVSHAVGADLVQKLLICPQKLVVINNPFDIISIQQKASEPCKLAGQDYLLHVGRFHPHKRHDRLLKAYAKSGISAPLVLIGTGSADSIANIKQIAVELGIVKDVWLLGFQVNPYPFIFNASLLILSSDSEGFGNVLIEALLCDTPVVSTRCPGGPVEILKNVGMAHALSELNEFALANKITEIYCNPPEINQNKLLDYSLNAICRKYLSLKK